MTDYEKYAAQVALVKEECKDADENDVAEEFRRYEEEFLIEPNDAVRSVILKFMKASGQEVKSISSTPTRVEKKVDRFADLGSEDKNVTIEVAVVTYVPRIQMVRGEEKQIAFGWIEDNPWESNDKRERWDFKDWGSHSENLAPNSVVRLEGVSVNEWNDKRSININRGSRVTILREGGPAVPALSDEPVTIEKASEKEGYVNLLARIISLKPDVIVKKDGSGTLDIFRGTFADSSGKISFLSWVPIEHEVGDLVKVEGAMIRKFRETPEVNINDRAKLEKFHDNNFASTEELSQATTSKIGELRNGMKDIITTVQVESWQSRTFTNSDGEEKIVRSGDVMDPTGRCRLTAWCEIDPKPGDFLHLSGARVQFWQGSPDLVVDNSDQVSNLTDAPWEAIDPEQHWVELELSDLVTSGSRRGIKTRGTIVAIRSDSGIIHRCPECRRILRESACVDHGVQQGVEDLRLKFVIDNGVHNAPIILAKEPSEKLLSMSQEMVKEKISKSSHEDFLAEIRNNYLARKVMINGRSLVDVQGAMILAEEVTFDTTSNEDAANLVMQEWGVLL
jgi:replication factor A1